MCTPGCRCRCPVGWGMIPKLGFFLPVYGRPQLFFYIIKPFGMYSRTSTPVLHSGDGTGLKAKTSDHISMQQMLKTSIQCCSPWSQSSPTCHICHPLPVSGQREGHFPCLHSAHYNCHDFCIGPSILGARRSPVPLLLPDIV